MDSLNQEEHYALDANPYAELALHPLHAPAASLTPTEPFSSDNAFAQLDSINSLTPISQFHVLHAAHPALAALYFQLFATTATAHPTESWVLIQTINKHASAEPDSLKTPTDNAFKLAALLLSVLNVKLSSLPTSVSDA